MNLQEKVNKIKVVMNEIESIKDNFDFKKYKDVITYQDRKFLRNNKEDKEQKEFIFQTLEEQIKQMSDNDFEHWYSSLNMVKTGLIKIIDQAKEKYSIDLSKGKINYVMDKKDCLLNRDEEIKPQEIAKISDIIKYSGDDDEWMKQLGLI